MLHTQIPCWYGDSACMLRGEAAYPLSSFSHLLLFCSYLCPLFPPIHSILVIVENSCKWENTAHLNLVGAWKYTPRTSPNKDSQKKFLPRNLPFQKGKLSTHTYLGTAEWPWSHRYGKGKWTSDGESERGEKINGKCLAEKCLLYCPFSGVFLKNISAGISLEFYSLCIVHVVICFYTHRSSVCGPSPNLSLNCIGITAYLMYNVGFWLFLSKALSYWLLFLG